MMRRIMVVCMILSCGGLAWTAADHAADRTARFQAIDVFIDSGPHPLAAYQFELRAEREDVKIVGVEGGEHAAFVEPPYYDPAALASGRIVIAAFHTGDDLPAGRTRVATVHVRVAGEGEARFKAELTVSASTSGERIAAEIQVIEKEKGLL
jgi:hypothetical protein